MSDAKAIIFVVDASTITRNGAAVAEHLHMILHAITSLPPSQITPPLIIHAHKSDLLVVRSNTPSSSVGTKSQARQLAKQRTKIILERELEKRRKTASTGVNVEGLGAVGSTGADSEADPLATGAGLECSGKDGVFSFSNWEGGDIEFSGGWVDVVRDDGIAGGEKEEIPESGENGLSELTAWLEGLP
ncbi:hypothetical protein FRB99_000325 [Tulasnella sp. 403]|nr:hypothetical protein FRB99_000325 [Tulasnella sp. 403]